jgi:hypothetical protein
MEAGASNLVLFHQHHAETQLGRSEGTGVTPAARTEDDEIKGSTHDAILSGGEGPRSFNVAAIIGA